jgi:hypothetical protein
MKLSDFVMLSSEDKKLAVLHLGVLIGKQRKRSAIAFLFQLENFYVETWFNCHDQSLREYLVFEHTRPLAPYLEKISLDELLRTSS